MKPATDGSQLTQAVVKAIDVYYQKAHYNLFAVRLMTSFRPTRLCDIYRFRLYRSRNHPHLNKYSIPFSMEAETVQF